MEQEQAQHKIPYPSDVSDDEWAFVAPYLTLMTEDAPQREHSLREVFNGLRWIVRSGAQWRMMPHDLPPWHTVYQQSQRWLKAGVFEAVVHDLRAVLRLVQLTARIAPSPGSPGLSRQEPAGSLGQKPKAGGKDRTRQAVRRAS